MKAFHLTQSSDCSLCVHAFKSALYSFYGHLNFHIMISIQQRTVIANYGSNLEWHLEVRNLNIVCSSVPACRNQQLNSLSNALVKLVIMFAVFALFV